MDLITDTQGCSWRRRRRRRGGVLRPTQVAEAKR
jgi:hypothetical protein